MAADRSPGDFREEFGRLVQELLDEYHAADTPISAEIARHLGVDAADLSVHGEELPSFELANLQLGLDALLGQPGLETRIVGIAGQGRRFSDVNLTELATGSRFEVGPPEYVHAAVGPKQTIPCLAWAVLLVSTPDGPLAVFVRRGEEHGPVQGLIVQALAPDPELAPRFLAELRQLMVERDVFRGQVISIEADRRGNRRVVFLERPVLGRDDLVLPDGVLDRIERHVVGPTRHREELVALGRHLGRGLLLWGPPGTGKTHTVRYLTSHLEQATVIILSGASLGMVGAFGNLARRLAPSVVVLEDVDLVAQERTFGPFGSNPALFELMNEMSGLAEDADVAFILTTNRPDALEPALAARPGRVDLAIEIPLPEAAERRRLLDLYARGIELRDVDMDDVVARTEGMTASFFKELVRKAAIGAVEARRTEVAGADVSGALDELLAESAALTRVLLGSGESAAESAPGPHAWMQRPSVSIMTRID